jgi:oligopeptide transport system substrate-binding protein
MLFFALNQSKQMLKKLLVLLTSVLFLTSCSTNPLPKKDKKTLFLNFTESPITLDPRKSGELVSSTFIFMMFEGLTKITPNSTSDYGLAEKIVIANDFKTYTFFLRDAYWSNGDPITSEDFAYSWKTLLEPTFPSPNAYLLFPIKNAKQIKSGKIPPDALGISCPNSKTLVVELEKPTPFFLKLTSFCTYFPVNHKIATLYPHWSESEIHFTCSGPFIFSKWKRDVEVEILPNMNYYAHRRILLDKINITFINDNLLANAMFQQGDIDIAGACFSEIPVEVINDKTLSTKVHFVPINSTYFCTFNLTKAPFNNVNIRKALSLAINRGEIVDVIGQKETSVARQIISPYLKENDFTCYTRESNVEKAKEYFEKGLEELSISKKDFPKFIFTYRNNPRDLQMAEIIQQQWRKTLGIETQLENAELKTFINKLIHRDYEVAQALWIAQYLDPMDIFNRFRYKENPKNYCHWENKDFQAVLDLSEKTTDPYFRKQLLKEAEQIMADESPISCICHYELTYLIQNKINGFYVSPIGSIHLDFISINEE